MGVADHTRRTAFADLKTALAGALGDGWTYDDRVDIRTAPQGRAHLYYSVGPWETDIDAARGKAADRAYHESQVVVTLAGRTKPKDREARRLTVADGLDSIERACVGTHVDELGLEVWPLRTTQRESASGEWWYGELTLVVRYTLALTA